MNQAIVIMLLRALRTFFKITHEKFQIKNTCFLRAASRLSLSSSSCASWRATSFCSIKRFSSNACLYLTLWKQHTGKLESIITAWETIICKRDHSRKRYLRREVRLIVWFYLFLVDFSDANNKRQVCTIHSNSNNQGNAGKHGVKSSSSHSSLKLVY